MTAARFPTNQMVDDLRGCRKSGRICTPSYYIGLRAGDQAVGRWWDTPKRPRARWCCGKNLGMRPEVWQVVTSKGPVVLVTGDTGTGKTSVLQSSTTEYPDTVLAPPVEVCLFDSGALQAALFDALAAAVAAAQIGQSRWRQLSTRLQHATKEAAIEVGKGLAKAVTQELMELAKARLGDNIGQGMLKFLKSLGGAGGDKTLHESLRTHSDGNIVRLLVRMADGGPWTV